MFRTVEKATALAEIPNLRYGFEEVLDIPRPLTWDDRKLTPAAKQSINLTSLGTAEYDPRKPESVEQVFESMDPRLHGLIQFCLVNNVTTLAGLQDAPMEIKNQLKDHALRPAILKYLLWKRSQAARVSPL